MHCAVKRMDKKNTNKLIDMLGLDEIMDKMAKANELRWYGHVLRREDGDVLQKMLEFKLDGQKKKGGLKMT